MRESTIENYFVRQVKKAGGEVRKLVTPGRRHAPDRLVLWPGGRADFIELKAPGEKPRAGQLRELDRLRQKGFPTFVMSEKYQVDGYLDSLQAYLGFFK